MAVNLCTCAGIHNSQYGVLFASNGIEIFVIAYLTDWYKCTHTICAAPKKQQKEKK